MTIAAGLAVSRFVHLLGLSILFGGALFPFYGFAPATADPCRKLTWLRPFLFGAALLALASGGAWFWFTAAGASENTAFGWLWPVRLSLGAALALLLLEKRATDRQFKAVVLGSLILLASIALTGHAGSDQSPAALQHRILDAFHLVASGIWIGALVVLAGLVTVPLRKLRDDDLQGLHHALARFSGIGTVVVAVLTLSGILNPGFSSSLNTAYGQVLLVKLALFAAMLALAAANRFWLTPRLSDTLESASGLQASMRALKISIITETMLAVLVLALVGWLGALSPPRP